MYKKSVYAELAPLVSTAYYIETSAVLLHAQIPAINTWPSSISAKRVTNLNQEWAWCNSRYSLLGQLFALILLCGLLCTVKDAGASDYSYRGNVSFQAQHFTENTVQSVDSQTPLSFASTLEITRGFDESNLEFTVTPFLRWDSVNDERSHFDFRELKLTDYGDNWELQVGIAQVFWGVAEARNIVNFVNQSDSLEGATSSETLGQPMIHVSYLLDNSTMELIVLPYFRPRDLGGALSRPRPDTPVSRDVVVFEANAEQRSMDVALRYSTTYNEWDAGFSLFRGTRREPELVLDESTDSLVPFYPLITQASADVQATIESWLLKAELAYQAGAQLNDHSKLVTGFEYTFYDIKSSGVDIGLVAEYLYDGLGETAFNIFDNDLLVGVRLALNDVQSTDATIAFSQDFETSGKFFTAEFSRRLGSSFKLTMEATTFANENYFVANIQRFF